MRREFTVVVRERDAGELARAAKSSGLAPDTYCSQVVEQWVAELRTELREKGGRPERDKNA